MLPSFIITIENILGATCTSFSKQYAYEVFSICFHLVMCRGRNFSKKKFAFSLNLKIILKCITLTISSYWID